MTDISDVLTVSFDSGLKDESVLCVTRKYGEKIIMLKMELGEQADILYYLLTEQMAKAKIETPESKENCKDCGNEKCKKLGTLPKGYDCALWQAEREVEE